MEPPNARSVVCFSLWGGDPDEHDDEEGGLEEGVRCWGGGGQQSQS